MTLSPRHWEIHRTLGLGAGHHSCRYPVPEIFRSEFYLDFLSLWTDLLDGFPKFESKLNEVKKILFSVWLPAMKKMKIVFT